MKAKRQVLILLGISFTAAIIIFLITPAFMKSDYQIKESIIIKSMPSKVYHAVADLKQLSEWSALIQTEKDKEVFISENMLFWKHKNAKTNIGKIILIDTELNKTVQLELYLEGYNTNPSPVYSFENTEEGTRVVVTDSAKIPYFMRYFAIEEAISTQYKKGLENLKKYTE